MKQLVLIITIILTLLLIPFFVYLDINDIMSALHISVEGWSTIINVLIGIIAVVFPLYILKRQKVNDVKRELINKLLEDELFTLIYSNENKVIHADTFAHGMEVVTGFVEAKFLSRIKIVSESGILSEKLAEKCKKFLKKKNTILNFTTLERERYLFPVVSAGRDEHQKIIFDNDYFQIFEFMEVEQNGVYLGTGIVVTDYTIDELIHAYRELDKINPKYLEDANITADAFLQLTDSERLRFKKSERYLDYIKHTVTDEDREKLKNTIRFMKNIHRRNTGAVSFSDGGYFPSDWEFCVVYTNELKQLCGDIIKELS